MWLRSWGVGYDGLYTYVLCMAPTFFYGLFIWHSRAMTRSALNKLGRGGCMVWLSWVLQGHGHVERLRSHRTVPQCSSPRYPDTLSDRSSGDVVEDYRPSRSRAERFPDRPDRRRIWSRYRMRPKCCQTRLSRLAVFSQCSALFSPVFLMSTVHKQADNRPF